MFRADRWDYVFTLKRQGVPDQARKLAVYFKGDVLERFEGDEMPTEAEFVASLDNRRKSAKVPVLEASPEALKAFAEKSPAPAATAPAASTSPLPVTYPPLESPSR
jgi:outer membrane protein assembly factor BamE